MSTLLIVMIVMFTIVMFLWLLGMLGANSTPPNPLAVTYSPWLAWFACLILGVAVFLVGSGTIVAERSLGK